MEPAVWSQQKLQCQLAPACLVLQAPKAMLCMLSLIPSHQFEFSCLPLILTGSSMRQCMVQCCVLCSHACCDTRPQSGAMQVEISSSKC